MKKTKKILPLLLALILVISSVPFAFAEKETVYSGFNVRSFGSYPQSEVTDETEKSKVAASLADFDFEKDGISYGFYSGSGSWGDGKMKRADYMFYTDVTVDGIKYRAVYIKELRPVYTGFKTSLTGGEYYNQPSNGYAAGEVYYFRFEPLSWRILDVEKGLVVCEKCIDSRSYSDFLLFSEKERTAVNAAGKKANDYASSSVREFLNGSFFDEAFTENEKMMIKETDTGCETPDSVFLLSSAELKNESYFPGAGSRKAQNTDYAVSLGANDTIRVWILRDSGSDESKVCRVGNSGIVGSDSRVDATFTGIRPAMTVDLKTNIFMSEDGFIYELKDDGTALVLGYNGKETQRLDVPSLLGGCDVTEIDAGAFSERGDVSTVCLPSTMKKLGDGIFGDGENIKNVILCCDESKLDKGANAFFDKANISAHDWDGGKVIIEPTYDTEGEKTYVCLVCGETKTEKIPALEIAFIKGDVDDDGFVTSADARLTLRASVGLGGDTDVNGNVLDFSKITREFLAADYKADRKIESSDARSILRVSVGLPED